MLQTREQAADESADLSEINLPEGAELQFESSTDETRAYDPEEIERQRRKALREISMGIRRGLEELKVGVTTEIHEAMTAIRLGTGTYLEGLYALQQNGYIRLEEVDELTRKKPGHTHNMTVLKKIPVYRRVVDTV